MVKSFSIVLLLAFVLCPILCAEAAQFIRVPCEIEITRLDAGIVQDAPGGAPKWMYTDWRLKEIAFKIKKVANQSNWELYRYGCENPTTSPEVLASVSRSLQQGKRKPHVLDMWDKVNYIAEVYKLLKKHRRKFSSRVKGPLIAHIIYTYTVNGKSAKPKYFRPRYLSGPKGKAGTPMTFDSNAESYTGISQKCSFCKGTGEFGLKTCPGCHGAGWTGPMMYQEDSTIKYSNIPEKCGLCNGTGKMGLKTCPGCHGAGWTGPMMYQERRR